MRPLPWLFSILFAAAVCWFVVSSSSFQSCIQKEQNAAANQQFHGDVAQFVIVYRHCIGGFVHSNAEAIIAAFTVILAFATIFLWDATQNLVRGAEKIAQIQLRPFVFGKGFRYGVNTTQDGRHIVEYVFWVEFENVGLTPAINVQIWADLEIYPMNEDWEPTFAPTSVVGSTVMAPRLGASSKILIIPLPVMMENWRREKEIFMWSRVEYRDEFNKHIIRHHEQCARVELIREPDVLMPPGHPSIILFQTYGPQNTVA